MLLRASYCGGVLHLGAALIECTRLTQVLVWLTLGCINWCSLSAELPRSISDLNLAEHTLATCACLPASPPAAAELAATSSRPCA